MSASPEPAGDAELVRLLDDYGQTEYEFGQVADRVAFNPGGVRRVYDRKTAARAALLAHVASHYVSRKEIADRDDRHNY